MIDSVGRSSGAEVQAMGTRGMLRTRRDVEVRGFCDVRSDSAKNFHEQYGGDYYTTDPDRVFSDPSVDIVSIATSHSSHADLAVAAFNAGKHLYLEKPMAMTTADCLRIYEAMKSADRKLMINFSIRFSGASREIKERIRSPKVSPWAVYDGTGGSESVALARRGGWRSAL